MWSLKQKQKEKLFRKSHLKLLLGISERIQEKSRTFKKDLEFRSQVSSQFWGKAEHVVAEVSAKEDTPGGEPVLGGSEADCRVWWALLHHHLQDGPDLQNEEHAMGEVEEPADATEVMVMVVYRKMNQSLIKQWMPVKDLSQKVGI